MFIIFLTKFYAQIKFSNNIKLWPKHNNTILCTTLPHRIYKTNYLFMSTTKFHNFKRINKSNLYLLPRKNQKHILARNIFTYTLTNKKSTSAVKNWNFFVNKLNTLSSLGSKMENPIVNRDLKENFKIQQGANFIKERLQKYNEIKEKRKNEGALHVTNNNNVSGETSGTATQIKKEIYIELSDGNRKMGECDATTPYDIAKSISKKLGEESIVAKVTYVEVEANKFQLCDIEEEEENTSSRKTDNTEHSGKITKTLLWDMNVPLIGNCKIEFLNFENEEGKKVFWHSSAHILGSALEKMYGGYLTIGPALKEGFYYDIFLGDFAITNDDYKKIEMEFNNIVKENVEFEKLICTKEEVLELFQYNPFKIELIKKKIPDGKKTSVYKCGDFIDLCLGPHIKSTGKVKTFQPLKNSAAYWLGDKNSHTLQRVYGISFQKKSELTDYLKFLEEAKKRDHRNIGKLLNFFFFEKDASPGSCFWLPKGAKIYNKLIEFIRREYRIRNYEEVITPNVYSCDLWKRSGHYQNYKDCMFIFNVEEKEWGMKPMNCPGHCLMFKQLNLSYRSLPLRFADFGVLHRNEISGSLSGLTRVRRFQQDDSHIFCAPEHIRDEVLKTLNFIFYIYDLFDFKYELFLSTRPEKYIGKLETWNAAEEELKNALNSAGIKWKLNEGDGAFYGPKIDILLTDSLKRTHQCGTIQLDFQLPLRFNLQYKSRDFVGDEKDAPENDQSQQQTLSQMDESNSKKVAAGKSQNKKGDGSNGVSETKRESSCNNNSISTKESNAANSPKSNVNSVGMDAASKKEEIMGNGRKEEQTLLNHSESAQKTDAEKMQSDDMESLKRGFERPIIIHRAILGSVERFIAILIEHTAGKLPFWISPRQAVVLPISDKYNDYANYVYKILNNHSFDVEMDLSVNTLNKKIREAQLKQFNFILVVGEKELTTQTVTVRDRDDTNSQKVMSIPQLVEYFSQMLQMNSEKLNQILPYEDS